MQGKLAREEEVERLRDELAAAAKEIEESARLIEEFQSLPLTTNAGASASISGSVKRKLKELESMRASHLENERLLAERDEQVAELTRLIHRYESGTYGLSEATKELRDVREQLRVRDSHIERLVEQLNALEERLEDVALENNDLRYHAIKRAPSILGKLFQHLNLTGKLVAWTKRDSSTFHSLA